MHFFKKCSVKKIFSFISDYLKTYSLSKYIPILWDQNFCLRPIQRRCVQAIFNCRDFSISASQTWLPFLRVPQLSPSFVEKTGGGLLVNQFEIHKIPKSPSVYKFGFTSPRCSTDHTLAAML